MEYMWTELQNQFISYRGIGDELPLYALKDIKIQVKID